MSTYRAKAAEPVHEFSSTHVLITGRPAQIMLEMGREIPDSDLADDGRETEPHATVKWGIHFQTPSARMREKLKEFGPVSLTLGRTSLFKSKGADVLKIDVDSPDLHRLNKLISSLSPTQDSHPTYQPHATLAYLKPGKGKKYSGSAALAGTRIKFDHVIFSGKHGHMEKLPLNGAHASYRVR